MKDYRRKSDKFIHISSQFERQNVGGGGGEGKLVMKCSKLDSRILSFGGEGGERKLGKTRKIRVVQRVGGGERETPLAKTTANEKRAREMFDPEACLPGTPTKRFKSSPKVQIPVNYI